MSGHSIMQRIYELYTDRPKVAVLMSGEGTNAKSLLADPDFRDLYDVSAVVTDNVGSNAAVVGEEHQLPVIVQHVDKFPRREARADYFNKLSAKLGGMGVEAAIYAGFMKISTPVFCENFPGTNIHPADLRLPGADGLPKYRGMNALAAMSAELGYGQSSVHVVQNPVDSGAVFAVTPEIQAEEDEPTDHLHQRLRYYENLIYPKTLVKIALGEITDTSRPYQFTQEELS